MKCPFCKSGDVRERGDVEKSTQKKNWKRAEGGKPSRRYFCGACKRVFRNPA